MLSPATALSSRRRRPFPGEAPLVSAMRIRLDGARGEGDGREYRGPPVEDAVLDRYDTALLISADIDLRPAIGAIRRLRPEKRIVAAFPPTRDSGDLRRAVDGYLVIGDDKIRRSQRPPLVVTRAGISLHRPKHWS